MKPEILKAKNILRIHFLQEHLLAALAILMTSKHTLTSLPIAGSSS